MDFSVNMVVIFEALFEQSCLIVYCFEYLVIFTDPVLINAFLISTNLI